MQNFLRAANFLLVSLFQCENFFHKNQLKASHLNKLIMLACLNLLFAMKAKLIENSVKFIAHKIFVLHGC